MCRRNRRKFHASDRNGVYHVFQMSHGAPQGIVMSFHNILSSSQWAQFLVFLYRYISLVQIESLLLQAMGKRSIIPAAPDVGSSPLKKYDFLEEDSDSPSAEQLGAVFADNDDTNEVRKKANELKPVFKPSVMKATSDGV